MNILLSILGKFGPVLAKVFESIAWSLLTEKVITRIGIALMDRLVKSSKNTLDDEIWKPAKEKLEESIS